MTEVTTRQRFSERRFLLPLAVILIGAGFVPFGLLTGTAWSAMATTLTTGYLGLTGWAEHTHNK